MILKSLNTMTLIVNLHLKIQILQKWLLDEILIMIKIMLKKMMKILMSFHLFRKEAGWEYALKIIQFGEIYPWMSA